jgi:hypothetical protein
MLHSPAKGIQRRFSVDSNDKAERDFENDLAMHYNIITGLWLAVNECTFFKTVVALIYPMV